jgi:hypothetical protein
MGKHEHSTPQDHEEHDPPIQTDEDHSGAATGAVIGTVAVGPLGAPIGAAAGAIADAATPDPNEPPSHTHDLDTPCYDGCPAWTSQK